MLHIEFCGVPGAGKTTLCRALTHSLKQKAHRTLTLEEAVTRALRRRNDGIIKGVLKRLPCVFWKRFMGAEYALPELLTFSVDRAPLWHMIFRAISTRDIPQRQRHLIMEAFFGNFSKYELLRRYLRPGELVLVEEGNSHRCFTLFGYVDEPVPEEEIRQYADLMPKPDYVLWADAAAEVCEDRLSRRQPLGFSKALAALDRPARLRLLNHGRACLEVLIGRLQTRGVTVLRVDNNGTQQQGSAQMRALADNLQRASVGGN